MKHWFVADFETVTMNTKYFKKHNSTTIHFGCINYYKDDNYQIFKTIGDMINILRNFGKHCLVYFHNLGWDGDFITKWLLSNNYKIVNGGYDNDIDKMESKTFSIVIQGTNFYKINLCLYDINKKNKFIVEFRCSAKLLSVSVEDLGQTLGLEKYSKKMALEEKEKYYDVEYSDDLKDYDDEFIEYCKRDVMIVKKSILKFDKSLQHLSEPEYNKNHWKYFKNFDWMKKLSISAIAEEILRRYLIPAKQIRWGLFCDKRSAEIADLFYQGGFTHINETIRFKSLNNIENGVYVDINSSYPSSMVERLPYGEVFEALERTEIPKNNVLVYLKIYVKEANAKFDEFLCLRNWKKENNFHYCKVLKDFVCYYTEEEWECIQKFYNFEGVKILKYYWLKASKWSADYIRDIYRFKELYSNKDSDNYNPAFKHSFKILLNSSYGKFAQRSDFDDLYLFDSKDELLENLGSTFTKTGSNNREYEIKDCWIHTKEMMDWGYPIYPAKLSPKEKYSNRKNHNRWIATTICSRSRVKLWNFVYEMGVENFMYCDTDSVFMRNVDKDKYLKYLDETKLGYWKVEDEVMMWTGYGPKFYAYKNGKWELKKKASGIDKDKVATLQYDDFVGSDEKDFDKAKKIPKYVKGGKVLVWKDIHKKPTLH